MAGCWPLDMEFLSPLVPGERTCTVPPPACGSRLVRSILIAGGIQSTLLPNGMVLAVGGWYSRFGVLSSTELYDPATDLWTTAASLATARVFHTATMLPSGKVLVVGGSDSINALSGTELYEDTQGVWTNVTPRTNATFPSRATLLPNGKVLVTGRALAPLSFTTNTAVLYDPATGTWKVTGALNSARNGHTATLLPNGKVLVAGGVMDGNYLSTAELYDPDQGRWTMTVPLKAARDFHTATLLLNGKVLVAGGAGAGNTSELYDPRSETWTITGPLNIARYSHTATLLLDGRVLVAGGTAGSSAELYDPATGRWKLTSNMNASRAGHSATLLPAGQVLVAGGGSSPTVASTELYDPALGLWQATGSMNQDRGEHSATLLSNGKVLVAGGLHIPTNGPIYSLSSAELYDPGKGEWTLTAPLPIASDLLTGVMLPNQEVLVVGTRSSSPSSSLIAQLYDAGLNAGAAWQPHIGTCTSPLSLGGSLTLTGSGFRGVSAASGGNSQDSATDYPLVQLRSLESGQTTFLLATNWQTNSFASAPVWRFPPGYALATVFVNGIPSTGAVVNLSVPVPTTTTLTSAGTLANGAFQFAFTNTVGALFGVLATTNPALAVQQLDCPGRRHGNLPRPVPVHRPRGHQYPEPLLPRPLTVTDTKKRSHPRLRQL